MAEFCKSDDWTTLTVVESNIVGVVEEVIPAVVVDMLDDVLVLLSIWTPTDTC